MFKNILFVTTILILAYCAKSQNHIYTVYKVYDGDTITAVNQTTGLQFRVRFICVDAPELSQSPWGLLAQKRLLELMPLGTTFTLFNNTIDMYGRTLAQVVNNKAINVNVQLISEGYLVWYYFQKGCNGFKVYEDKAKAFKLNVWSDPNFVMPWDYRKNTTTSATV